MRQWVYEEGHEGPAFNSYETCSCSIPFWCTIWCTWNIFETWCAWVFYCHWAMSGRFFDLILDEISSMHLYLQILPNLFDLFLLQDRSWRSSWFLDVPLIFLFCASVAHDDFVYYASHSVLSTRELTDSRASFTCIKSQIGKKPNALWTNVFAGSWWVLHSAL